MGNDISPGYIYNTSTQKNVTAANLNQAIGDATLKETAISARTALSSPPSSSEILLSDGTGVLKKASIYQVLSSLSTSSSNTPNAIVARDASGNFSAGTITAALTGNATTATTATTASACSGNAATASAAQSSSTLAKATAKAWANMTGTGVNGLQTINAHLNINSINKTAAATFAVTFVSAMTDANYVVVANHVSGTGIAMANALTTTGFTLTTYNNSNSSVANPVGIQFAVFGN
jgi:hypothetical protein